MSERIDPFGATAGKPLRVKLQYAFNKAELAELVKVFQQSSRNTIASDKIFDRIERAIDAEEGK